MSEPVSNAEIEDVLSSIRRLVSENTDPSRPVSERGETTEKLVLTPAFRVLDTHDSTPETLPEEQGADAIEAEQAEETPEPQDMFEPASDSIETADLGQKIAALEAAISDSQEEWEPDGSEQEVAEAEPIILQRAATLHDVEALTPEAVEAPDDASYEPVEEAVANPTEEIQIDDVEIEDVELEVEDVEIATDEPGDILADDTGEGDFLDEDMLREMVIKLVREELKGRIGERITRNVRRLVHREIRRAMAIRDLE